MPLIREPSCCFHRWNVINISLVLDTDKAMYKWSTMCRTEVWTDMKVLGADLIILGTRLFRRMFLIKQKFDTTAAYLENQNNFNFVNFWELFRQVRCKLCPILTKLKHFYYRKTAAVSNFCLIGNICHSFLGSRMIESAPKTFMSIQILVLHKVDKVKSLLKENSYIHLCY